MVSYFAALVQRFIDGLNFGGDCPSCGRRFMECFCCFDYYEDGKIWVFDCASFRRELGFLEED